MFKSFDDRTILIVDDSDISKPCSKKPEGLYRVLDGNTGEIADGYWFSEISALTAEHKQSIPVYIYMYSGNEEGYTSNNSETLKSLKFMSAHFPETTIRALDRGYDAGCVFDYFIPHREFFVVRMNDRTVLYKGKKP